MHFRGVSCTLRASVLVAIACIGFPLVSGDLELTVNGLLSEIAARAPQRRRIFGQPRPRAPSRNARDAGYESLRE